MSKDSVQNKTLLDEFQVKGNWWLPNSEKEVPGILFYSKDAIKLELIGSISEFGGFDQSINIMFGVSDKGERFTLLNSINLRFTMNMPGFQTETFSVNSFLVGDNIHNLDDTLFESAVFMPTYFTKWMFKTPYEQEYDNNKLKSINMKEQNLFSEYVSSIDSEINETYNSTFNGNIYDNFSWNSKGGFKIIPSINKNYHWFEDIIFSLKSLYTLFIGYPTYFENIYLYIDDSEVNKPKRKLISLFYPQRKVNIREKFEPTDSMINYYQLEVNFNRILNNWFEKQHQLKDIIILHQSDLYVDAYLHTELLNSVQTLEVYHRSFKEGKIFEESEYLKYAEEISNFVENKFPKFADKINGMLKHGNEYSLSKRLRDIISTLDDETKKYLIGNSDNRGKFVQQLVDTRNYLTHYDVGEKKNILESVDELFYAVQRLKALATIVLFNELGIEEKITFDNIKNGRHFSSSISAAKKILN